jgi:hypothetical protein
MRYCADSSFLVRLYDPLRPPEEARALRPGGHDLVLVAAAVAMGAAWFLSFDRNSHQRPLAGVAGLRVWPPLDKEEKGLVRRAAQPATR